MCIRDRYLGLKKNKEQKLITVHRYGAQSILNEQDLVLAVQESIKEALEANGVEYKGCLLYTSFLISSLNKLQEIENKSILCRELILWHENRMNALKFLRRKGELQKESEAIGLVQGDLLELIKERESLLSKFENIVPRTGDKSIATVDDVKGFSCVNGDVLTELLRNPKSCKSNNGNRILFCANFYV